MNNIPRQNQYYGTKIVHRLLPGRIIRLTQTRSHLDFCIGLGGQRLLPRCLPYQRQELPRSTTNLTHNPFRTSLTVTKILHPLHLSTPLHTKDRPESRGLSMEPQMMAMRTPLPLSPETSLYEHELPLHPRASAAKALPPEKSRHLERNRSSGFKEQPPSRCHRLLRSVSLLQ